MRRSRHRRMYGRTVRRNAGTGRYAQKTGVNLFSIVVIIGLAVALGFLTTKCVIYPLILGQEASFDVVLDKIGFISDKDSKDGEDENTSGAAVTDQGSNNVAIPSTDNQGGDNTVNGGDVQGNAASDGQQNQTQTQPQAQTDQAQGTPQTVPVQSGYAIQFGSFSTEGAANALLNELKNSGIDAALTQKDGLYKVIGQIFADKESAVNTKINIDAATGAKYSDAFVASF